jgi:hypothetical protein
VWVRIPPAPQFNITIRKNGPEFATGTGFGVFVAGIEGLAGGLRCRVRSTRLTPADAAGVTLVTTDKSTYLVTSDANYQGTSRAVGAALNTHGSLPAGLRDAVKRMATIDPGG